MANMLDIHVEPITPASFDEFERIATVDVQPHYFGGRLQRADLVIDHHPEQPGYSAVFKDIRADYGSTCTILTEHLRAVDVNISERTATAMLYAIKSDTLFFARHTNRVDLEAFTFLYPLADAALIRKMEGAEITLERLDYVNRASQGGLMREQVFCAFVGEAPREDFIPYTADFFLQLEDVKWTIIAGVVGTTLIISVQEPRLLAQRRRVREALVRRNRQRRRPPRDGQGGRADGALSGEIRAARGSRDHGAHRGDGRAVPPGAGGRSRQGIAAALKLPVTSYQLRTSSGCGFDPGTTQFWPRLGHWLPQRLIEIRDQVLGILQADRQPRHAAWSRPLRAAPRRYVPTATSARADCTGFPRRRGWRLAG